MMGFFKSMKQTHKHATWAEGDGGLSTKQQKLVKTRGATYTRSLSTSTLWLFKCVRIFVLHIIREETSKDPTAFNVCRITKPAVCQRNQLVSTESHFCSNTPITSGNWTYHNALMKKSKNKQWPGKHQQRLVKKCSKLQQIPSTTSFL